MYQEFRKIVLATIGVEEQLRSLLLNVDGIKEVYIYGSYAKNAMGPHSDIDVLVIGSASVIYLQKQIHRLQSDMGREINVSAMGKSEFKRRIDNKDPFIVSVLKQKHIKII